MSDAIQRDPELVLLTDLCRQLAALGVSVGLSDARPAVTVHSLPNPLWITVSASGEAFEWGDAAHQHPVTDAAGAAYRICEHAKAQRSGAGEL